jgi:hypothetical protein
MGKLKQSLIEAQDRSYASFKRDPQEFHMNQQDWAQYEAEFNAWLDAYEASFGGEEQS